MVILISIWTYWCFLVTFLVYIFLLPLNLFLVFFLGEYGKNIFIQYNRYVGNVLLMLYGMIRKVKGAYPINFNEPCIYIANHKSYLDVIIISSLVPQKIKYLGKKEVFDWPLIGFFAKYSGQIAVQREDKDSRSNAYDLMKKSINEGYSIVLFPEGGWRNRGDEKYANPYDFKMNKLLNPFRNGAFRLAIETQTPIIPIALINAGDKFSSKTMKIIPGTLHIHVFDRLFPVNITDPLVLNQKCYDLIYKKLEEYNI